MPAELSIPNISTAAFREGVPVNPPTPSEAFRTWARVAVLSFGGPAGQIAVMHRVLVEERRWIGEQRFLHALSYCMLLPGPGAHELAIYIGWLVHRVLGGLVAGILFVLPGLISLSVLGCIYVVFGSIGVVQALFLSLKAAVLAVVLEAVVRVGKRALKSSRLIAVAAFAFVGIYFFPLPFPLTILSAALIGYAANIAGLMFFRTTAHGPAKGDAQQPGEMLVGLGFAETTPGPLISVVQFVGLMAAYRQPGPLDPIIAGLLGGFLTKWCTFVPPFLRIFLGGPYIEAPARSKSLNAVLSAITAAIVGVILNLAIWFSLHTLFVRMAETQRFGISFVVPGITGMI